MNKITSINTYDDIFDLIKDWEPERLTDLSEDTKDFLRHHNDFESIRFVVVNDNTVFVTDSISGKVLTDYTLEGFIEIEISYSIDETK